jgi:hypothetical protein
MIPLEKIIDHLPISLLVARRGNAILLRRRSVLGVESPATILEMYCASSVCLKELPALFGSFSVQRPPQCSKRSFGN